MNKNSIKSLVWFLIGTTITAFSICMYISYFGEYIKIDRECFSKYKLLNDDFVCTAEFVVNKTGYIKLQNQVSSYIDIMKETKKVSNVSVYFRDLENGPVFGVEELASFSPASLLKTPIAFTFLFYSESQPEILSKKIKYLGTTSVSSQRVQPRVSAVEGEDYTIEQLLEMMMSYSDNASYEALEAFLSATPDRKKIRSEVMQELGLIDPTDRIEKTLTVRSYASLFRILYNAAYLNSDNSQKILYWLTQGDYHQGIEAGVPRGTLVSHKFGERLTSDNKKQLHDCGIVYYPKNPYLLCIMTMGDDFIDLESIISEISKMVYEEFDSRKL